MLSSWLIVFLYSIAAYGLSNMMVFGSGPFRIFEHIRYITSAINEHFGSMFSCMMCFPANVGLVCSLVDWFLLPSIAITPFNLLLVGTNLWWVAMLGDIAFTSGIVWFIHHVELFFENIAEGNTPNSVIDEEDNNDVINVHGGE